MDDFGIDLDQALNELERQECEQELDLKKNNQNETSLEIETSLQQGVIPEEQNKFNKIHFDSIYNQNLITTQSENDMLESELNEIMQSLVVNSLSDLVKSENDLQVDGEKLEQDKKEELIILDELISEDTQPINDKIETNPIQIQRSESIELEFSNIKNHLNNEEESGEDKNEKKEIRYSQDTIDEKFSSPNEDSECYFDTIEMTTANSQSNNSGDNKESSPIHNIEDTNQIQTNEVKELKEEIQNLSDDILNNQNDLNGQRIIQDKEIEEDSNKTTHDSSVLPDSPVNCFESLNDLNKTDLTESVLENSNEPINEEEIKPLEHQIPKVSVQKNSQDNLELASDQVNNSNEPTVDDSAEQAVNNLAPSESTLVNKTSTEVEINVPIEIIDYQTEWSQLSESEKTLGLITPQWMPDSETDVCLKCAIRFSFRTRRHHCRACGLIFCSKCCHLKLVLSYNISDDNVQPNKNQMSRCCNVCYEIINKVNNLKLNMQKVSSINTPIVSVLKKKSNIASNQTSNETIDSDQTTTITSTSNESEGTSSRLVRSKSVRFSDGVAPGTENTPLPTLPSTLSSSSINPNENETRVQSLDDLQLQADKIKKKSSYLLSKKYKISNKNTYRQSRFIEEELITRIRLNLIKNNLLPPILEKDEIVDTGTVCPDEETLIKEKLLFSDSGYITFMLLRNLKVYVRIINFDCDCLSKQKCWLFTTNGLCLNGQEELVFILKCLTDEQTNELKETQIPREILYHIMDIYDKSSKGYKITHMSHLMYEFENLSPRDTTKTNELLNNRENVGFLFYYPSEFHFKCCLKICNNYLPEDKFLFGYLIQKWELAWAKLFPLRLYLSIGERFRSYPTCIISDRHRKSVFGDIGHTIMSLLCDVRNFQYTIAQIDGLRLQLENTSTRIIIPESQYDLIVKSILTSNDYVFSLACLQMDDTCCWHLAAVENENLGSYSSKTISFNHNDDSSISSGTNKVTGAGFVVFNGALKANLTNNAKVSVIEDGIMIQIETDTMNKLKQALQSMKPFRLDTLKPNLSHQTNLDNNVISVEWTKDSHINKSVYSIIDKRPLNGVKSLKLSNTYDYVNETKGLRWTEIYLIQIEDDSSVINDNNFNLNRFADMCSTAFCTAITPLLEQLVNLQKIYLTSQNKTVESMNPIYENNPTSSKKTDLLKYSQLINPFKVALRISVDKDQVGYLIGMNGSQISDDIFLTNLDNELIQLLNHASSFNISICLEFVFYVQERFNCSNKYVIQH